MDASDDTRILLLRWHAGDRQAIDTLLARDLPWIRDLVRARLGPLLRARGETMDYVQDAIFDVLGYMPRFVTTDRARFRALVAKIIENHLRDAHDHHSAARRSPARERPVPTDSVLDLDRPQATVTQPGSVAERHEREAWVRLALELLETEDRQVLLLRQWQGLEFADIGAQMGLSADGARMRFQRALPRLAQKLESLHAGREPL
ncbi:MAG: sigma-70 family RNA polymerase sigma factor [Planctomycetes bacterium]|nr:sigma-70 family RNA polymerase sigma factor [Planctomycetota bacterium]